MPTVKPFLLSLLATVAVQVAGAAGAAGKPVHSLVGDAAHWTATDWSADDAALFGGEPEYGGEDRDLILVRYSYFVADYDVDRLGPLWVAHVDEQDAELKDRARKGAAYARPSGFVPDDNVVAFSRSLGLPFVTDRSYENANPPELPAGPTGYGKITRGHNASNQEMKSEGDPAAGMVSQDESFSLANVLPQMQHHNAPIWAKLEDDCLAWAAKLGRIAVITGPVYAPDPAQPPPVGRILHTAGRDGVRIPIPTHFFKIIIGRIDGKLAAVGFLVPHRDDLRIADLPRFVVPIRRIEELTHLNFMPKLGADNPLEAQADARWLKIITQ
jgi:DNA/RNA endonuclease G (NUC1)